MSEYDAEKIFFFVCFVLLIVGAIYAATLSYTHIEETPLRERCEANPALRYENKCSDYNDCIRKCVEHMKKTSNSET